MHDVWLTDAWMPSDGVMLEGALVVPQYARGVVAFAQGSGSNRFSRRNREVAAVEQRAGMAMMPHSCHQQW
jgi:hypothetical protein